ncbi:AP-4 complex subunit epsilon, putative [Plasmodium malariae]|uniref:AP-4 complex subunit epsilon, putative n=1 Tax=Plasmodium malariae TaxID=5858 RepID=A0A1D3JM07_PLAMA|nr:AP-4 complex subunit epsilon, putative [Plasmodium malariae]SBT87695.1 AP-4 complex subunit epsilon, putative [Plasmodium malariae]
MLGLGGSCLSKEFFDLAKSIGEAPSKQEEDRIICNEIVLLKSRFADPNATVKQIKEYLIRAIYIEMLGHDASFAYIHAVKLAHEKNILCKRTGYLSCNLFLNKDHELMLLLINTIQKDLKSDNHLEIWAALNCVCKLLNSEMIPAIFPIIKNLLNHKNELIRKKVCMLLHKIYLIDPLLIKDIDVYLKKLLCDVDPSVMGASLNLIACIAKNHMMYCIKLVPYLVSILKQICENKLPKEYDYHRIPAPWIQIKILSIFRILGFSNKKLSEQMYEVLQKTMQRADFGINVGYAIIYECVKTIAIIYPSHNLLELASLSISRFISSDNHNLKYVGVTGLALIVKINPMYASKHQLAVVDCLEDKDETLKMKTLDLLYQMTNPLNVKVIVDKLLFHIENSLDIHFKHDLACKTIQLIERYTPDDIWFLNKINSLFLSVGELLDESYSYSLIKLLKDSSICAESDSDDGMVRSEINEGINSKTENVNIECLNIVKEENNKVDLLDTGEKKEEGVEHDVSKGDERNAVSVFERGNGVSNENSVNGANSANIAKDGNDSKVDAITNERASSKNYNMDNAGKDIGDKNNTIDHESNVSGKSTDEKKLKGKRKMNYDVHILRKYAINTYVRMLENNENIPFILMQIICWVLGEYSYLCDLENYTIEDIIDLLCECLEKNFNNPDRVKSCIITAIFKLCAFNNITDHVVAKKLIEKYKNSQITDMQQRCYEYDLILNNPTLMKNLFCVTNNKKKISIDENLSFLNPFIEKHLENGGKSYITKELRRNENNFESSKNNAPVLNFTPYELPLNNKINVDTFHTSNNNYPYQKNYKYDSPVLASTIENFSTQNEKEKSFKLNVVGPKKWKKETCEVERKNSNKNSKRKFTKLREENQENRYDNNYHEDEGEDGGDENEEEDDGDDEGYDERDDDDDEEEDDEEDEEEDEDEGGNYGTNHYSLNEEEDEKRLDSIDGYDDQNYERFDDTDSHNLKEYKYEDNSYDNNVYNKQRGSHMNNDQTTTNNELTEKEKMAAALFNGLISNNSSVFQSKNNYSSNYSSKKRVSLLSNRNYFNFKRDNNKNDSQKNSFDERGYQGKTEKEDDVSINQDEQKKMTSRSLLDSSLNNLKKNEDMRDSNFSYDMLDLNESFGGKNYTEVNNASKDEDKNLWNNIGSQKKAVFLNTSKLNIFQIIKHIENKLRASVVEVSKREALTSCIYNNNRVLIKIRIEDNKLIFLVKSADNKLFDSVFDILRNLFHL